MFYSKNMQITIPSGPYPKCSKNDCGGTMVPIVEPATTRYPSIGQDCWVEGTVVLYWKCVKCNHIVK